MAEVTNGFDGRIDALAREIGQLRTESAVIHHTLSHQSSVLERVGEVLERIARIDERTLAHMEDLNQMREWQRAQDAAIAELQRIAARNTTGISGTERIVFGGVTGVISVLAALAVTFMTP
jgi:hypothetical protein